MQRKLRKLLNYFVIFKTPFKFYDEVRKSTELFGKGQVKYPPEKIQIGLIHSRYKCRQLYIEENDSD